MARACGYTLFRVLESRGSLVKEPVSHTRFGKGFSRELSAPTEGRRGISLWVPLYHEQEVHPRSDGRVLVRFGENQDARGRGRDQEGEPIPPPTETAHREVGITNIDLGPACARGQPA